MVVWLQLSYRWALPLEYWLAQCKVRPSMWITNQKLHYIMYRYFSAHAEKRVAGWNGWCNGIGNVRQCKGRMDLKQLCSSVRATPSNIPNGHHAGSTRIQGWVRWDWWGDCDWIWSGTVRGWLVEIGMSHQIWWNILREHNWGVPSAHIKFIYILCYIYFRVFDHATGMCAYRCVHNTIITCMRIIIPMIGLRVFGVAFGLSWAEINRELHFNVFLTLCKVCAEQYETVLKAQFICLYSI